MGLPELERFTLEQAAIRLRETVPYVEEMVRTLRFTHIIIVGELIGGSPLTRHLYFDRALWIKHFGKKMEIDPAGRLKELEEQIKRYEKEWKKRFGEKFDPSTLRKAFEEHIGPTACNIGPNEVANLWNPFPPQNEWKRPREPVQVYIPRLAVEAFERKHGLRHEANAQKAEKIDKGPIPDASEIEPEKWYSTYHTARFLGVTQKHVQNRLIDKLRAEKTGGRWRIQGHRIRTYGKEHSQDS